jgi:leucyl/phenylalanyl-tRNA---protein transferase
MNYRLRPPSGIPPETLLAAYRQGWFPMGQRGSRQVEWFSPDPRGVLPLDRYHAPKRLARLVRQSRFAVTIDTAFLEVVQRCAASRDETWISEVIVTSYANLHRLGHAHSVEVRVGDRLVGGLYGAAIGGAFFGESMFHTMTDASKVALDALIRQLTARGFTLLDVQWRTPHLAQFGVIEIPRDEYLRRLAVAVRQPATFA